MTNIRFIQLLLLLLFCGAGGLHAETTDEHWEVPRVVLKDVPFSVVLKDTSAWGVTEPGQVQLEVNGQGFTASEKDGVIRFDDLVAKQGPVSIKLKSSAGNELASSEVPAITAWFSLIPALMAVTMALLLRNVLVALFTSLLFGGWLVYGLSLDGALYTVLDSCQEWVVNALTDEEHIQVIVFCFLIGGLVGIISRNGGTMGIANLFTRFIRTRRQTQVTTSALGLAIFFDDYANSLIVGNTMKKISDTMRISREKLAYIVDATAAPVSTILFVTTWIGFQVGVINDGIGNLEDFSETAYSVFLNSLVYNFYPILAILFVFMVTGTGKDFGPMLKAERRAFHTGRVLSPAMSHDQGPSQDEKDLEAKPGVPQRAINAVVPMLVLIAVTMIGIYMTGLNSPDRADDSLREIVGNADSFASMMWGSLIGCMVAMLMTLGQRLLSVHEVTEAWCAGAKAIMLVIFVLTLAWSLSAVNDVLHTSDFLISVLGDTLSPHLLPACIFLLSAFMAFATGSSWGVMGIMMPMVIPLVWAVLGHNNMLDGGEYMYIFYASVSGVLAGAVWGDHCSPLAESTLLSAMASGCDLIDHVRSQMPYCLLAGGVALILCCLPVGFGFPWWLSFLISSALLFGVLAYFGQSAETIPAEKSVNTSGELESL